MRLIDISRDTLNTEVYPGDPEPLVTRVSSIGNDSDCNLSALFSCVHTGTHVDAPLHFIEGGESVDKMKLDAFIGPCTVIEINASPVTGEYVNNRFPRGCERILIKGNGNAWFMDSAAEEAAALKLKLIGTDALSIGCHGNQIKPHKAFLGNGIAILEGLDLKDVEPGNYFLVAAPLKLGGLEGAPARAVLIEGFDLRTK